MSKQLTEITELSTALGMLSTNLDAAFARRPAELLNVPDDTWEGLANAWNAGVHQSSFLKAFDNGHAFLDSTEGLRGRRPRRVEWKGLHRPPGDNPIPADLRVDHVYLLSCKYLSKVLLNPGPRRLFDHLLVGDSRDGVNWFAYIASTEFQAFYRTAVDEHGLTNLPNSIDELEPLHRQTLKSVLRGRQLPDAMQVPWRALCSAVSANTAQLWNERLGSVRSRQRLLLLWRMLRISDATYYVLGTNSASHLRFRIDSAWDWNQSYELRRFVVYPRDSGQPEVGWQAEIRRRAASSELLIDGHIEIRWSHGRFYGVPEAKVYLDTPHADVPGYNLLT